MAIMSRSGFSKKVSQQLNDSLGHGPDFPETTINSAPSIEELTDPVDSLNNKPFVKDPALQQLNISTTQYPQSYNQLQAYMAGHALTCVYFSKWNVNEGIRSNQVDSPYLKNVIHSSWLRIDDFEINLTEAFNYAADAEKAQSEVTLVGRTYPGVIVPKTGDYLVVTIGDQKEGLFVVSTVSSLSWRNDRAYQLGAYMVSTLSKEEWDVLNAAVVQRLEFSKANYANGTKALLTSSEAQAQKDLQKYRNILADRYFKTFYTNRYDTLMRPDGFYDPYIVRFVNDLTDINITHCRARQLYYSVDQSYWKTLYARLEDNDSNSLDGLYSQIIPETRLNVTVEAYITPLTGRGYLTMDYYNGDLSTGGVPYDCRLPYVCSQGFYDGNITEMSEFEHFLYDAITTGRVTDFRTLFNVYIKTWQSLNPMEQFYRIPIYIWLIDLCLSSITVTTA